MKTKLMTSLLVIIALMFITMTFKISSLKDKNKKLTKDNEVLTQSVKGLESANAIQKKINDDLVAEVARNKVAYETLEAKKTETQVIHIETRKRNDEIAKLIKTGFESKDDSSPFIESAINTAIKELTSSTSRGEDYEF